MKALTSLALGAALAAPLAVLALPAAAQQMSFAVHDVLVTSNVPAVNVSVRNLSPSPDPALRDLRVVSPAPVLNVSGQVWCKSFDHAHTRADAAQIVFGNATLASTPNGADVVPLGIWSPSPVVQLGANQTLRNFSIQAPVQFPDHWGGGVSLTFNPAQVVEQRLQQYVENGAGTAADFLRVDDVFEETITLNAVGWCEYESQNLGQKRYAGVRSIEVPVHIFYHGDPDVEDQVVAVGSAGTVQAQQPGPGPAYAPPPPRRGETRPPRREESDRRDDSRRRPPAVQPSPPRARPDRVAPAPSRPAPPRARPAPPRATPAPPRSRSAPPPRR